MKARKSKLVFWKEYGLPFLACFVVTGVFLFLINPFEGFRKIPAVVIVLSPHFDDGVLSLGGFMSGSPTPVVVATLFAENPSDTIKSRWDTISGFASSAEAVAARTEENKLALERVGAHPLNLRYLDLQYRYGKNSALREQIVQSVKKDIEITIDAFSTAKEISIYGPAEFGPDITHPDHKIVHDAFTEVAREKWSAKNIRFFYFEDFPYVANFHNSTTTPLKTFLENQNGGVFLRETPIPLTNAALDKKIQAIGAYSSQDKAFSALGENISAAAKTFAENRCKRMSPPITACEVVYEIKN